MLEIIAVIHNAGLNHFTHQVISFTGSFTHTRKYRHTFVSLGNVIDKFHDDNGFSYSGTTKKTDFPPF